MKKLTVLSYINAALILLFVIFSFPFQFNVSTLAFPLAMIYAGVFIYFDVYELVVKKTLKHLTAVRQLIEYEPIFFMVTFVLQRTGKNPVFHVQDIIQAIIWTCILIVALVTKYAFLKEKRIVKISEEWANWLKDHPAKVYKGWSRVGYEVVTTLDAIAWAISVIFLVNIFLVQIYVIPSESMVPTFLVKDRVISWKTIAGPKLPLSDAGLPDLQKYDRGDVVVFHNPHYSDDRDNEIKSTISNIVFMLTFTLAKTNVDEDGNLKADPLVKRITGVPGEQLMLVDGNLYARTKDSPEFKLVEKDSTWAKWDLNTLPAAEKSRVELIPLSTFEVDNLEYIEASRRSLNIAEAAAECEKLASYFEKNCIGGKSSDEAADALIPSNKRTIYSLFTAVDEWSEKLLKSDGGAQWFRHFMTDWISEAEKENALSALTEEGSVTGTHLIGGDLYSDSLFRLNIMTKLAFGRLAARNVELALAGVSGSEWTEDALRVEQFEMAQRLSLYIVRMDFRNMGIFPSNDVNGNATYIPEDNYFLMGDNRFNSLDMRHSYTVHPEKLYPSDSYSILYSSRLDPQYVNRSRIEGKASFRVWPFSHIGPVNKSAK